MTCCKPEKKYKGGCLIEVIISIIVGVIFGILFSNGLIPVALNFIKIALILSAMGMVILGATLFAANFIKGRNEFRKCFCRINICLLISTIGTFLAGTAAATIGLTITSTISVLAVALTMFFFIWLVLSVISLFLCLIKETCTNRHEEC